MKTEKSETITEISLRDYFAAHALASAERISGVESVARYAYLVADAMLAQRENEAHEAFLAVHMRDNKADLL